MRELLKSWIRFYDIEGIDSEMDMAELRIDTILGEGWIKTDRPVSITSLLTVMLTSRCFDKCTDKKNRELTIVQHRDGWNILADGKIICILDINLNTNLIYTIGSYEARKLLRYFGSEVASATNKDIRKYAKKRLLLEYCKYEII